MSEPSKSAASCLPLILLAALVLLGAGGFGLYAMRSGGDNSVVVSTCADKVGAGKAIAANATGEVAAMSAIDPRDLSALAFTGPDGQAMTLADFRGKTVLLNLWATWCAPCRAEMPALDELQGARGGNNFEVVALNMDHGDNDKPQQFFAEIGIRNLAHYRDASLKSFNTLKGEGLVLGLPVTMLVDKDGCALAAMNGPAHWSGDDAMRFVDAAVGE